MALTKTTTIVEIDAWQAVAVASLVVGTAKDISGSYDPILYIEAALTDADAQEGMTIIVEISYADDDWTKLYEFTGTAETPNTTPLADDPLAAGSTTINLDDASAGDFGTIGRKWFILDGVDVSKSESVRTKSISTNAVGVCQDTLRAHVTDTAVWDRVDEWGGLPIPMAAAYVRILYNNTDANAVVHVTSRLSTVTGL